VGAFTSSFLASCFPKLNCYIKEVTAGSVLASLEELLALKSLITPGFGAPEELATFPKSNRPPPEKFYEG